MRKQGRSLIVAVLAACSSRPAPPYWRVDLEAADADALMAQLDRLHAERGAWPDVVVWKSKETQYELPPGCGLTRAEYAIAGSEWLGRSSDTVLFHQLVEFGVMLSVPDHSQGIKAWCTANDLPYCIGTSQASYVLVPESQFARGKRAAEQDQRIEAFVHLHAQPRRV